MAKKSTKKAPPKKAAPKKAARPVAGTVSKRRALSPRNVALPGMEQQRDATLSALCRDIGDLRDDINQLTQEYAGKRQAALNRMIETGAKTYHDHGVQLVVEAGPAKITVKTWKEPTAAPPAAPAKADDAPSGDGEAEE